jgi:hypothetical protein
MELPPDDDGPGLSALPGDDDGPCVTIDLAIVEALSQSFCDSPQAAAVQLPSSAEEEEEEDNEASRSRPCCTADCQVKLAGARELLKLKAELAKRSLHEQNEFLATLLAVARGTDAAQRHSYSLAGCPVCFVGFCRLLGVAKKRVRRVINFGCAPVDQRCGNSRVPNAAGSLPCQQVDAFLNYMWEFLAEPLAEGIANDDNPYLAVEAPVGDIEGELEAHAATNTNNDKIFQFGLLWSVFSVVTVTSWTSLKS